MSKANALSNPRTHQGKPHVIYGSQFLLRVLYYSMFKEGPVSLGFCYAGLGHKLVEIKLSFEFR